MASYPSYHSPIMQRNHLDKVIEGVKEYLSANPDVVAIAGSGLSSVPLVAIICYLTGLSPIYVRREEETPHDRDYKALTPHEGGRGRYIVLDDLVSSGRTVRYVQSMVKELMLFESSLPKAVLVYSELRSSLLSFDDGDVPLYYVGVGDAYYDYYRFKTTMLRNGVAQVVERKTNSTMVELGKSMKKRAFSDPSKWDNIFTDLIPRESTDLITFDIERR